MVVCDFRQLLFLLFAGGCTVFTIVNFEEAFPIVSLKIAMDRVSAVETAQKLRNQHQSFFRPLVADNTSIIMDAASFSVESNVQHFVELEGGGNKAFADMLKNKKQCTPV